jgi:hypothetical protein
MFFGKSVNKINGKRGLCPPLCRNPLPPRFINNLVCGSPAQWPTCALCKAAAYSQPV